MKAIAFSTNDIAVVAWTFGGGLKDCLGFAIYRIDVLAGAETPLAAMATFKGQSAETVRPTVVDPVQKFFSKDVYAVRDKTYQYKVVPMGGTPGNLQPTALRGAPLQSTPANAPLRCAVGPLQLAPTVCHAVAVIAARSLPSPPSPTARLARA